MDNLGILVQAILSLKDTKASKDQIASELPKLESQLQSDKNTRIKIVAGLDIAKSKNLIQSQLNTLTNQAKAPAIKIGIDTSGLNSVQGATQNITNGLKNVQTQAQQTASAVNNVKSELIKLDTTSVKSTSFKMGVDKDGIFNLEKTIENARNALSKFGKVDLSWLKDSAGEVTAITAKITDATGAVERFHYTLNEGTQRFDWAGSVGTDSGVEKLITSMQKAQDKVKALRTNITADLKSIRSAWQDVNGGKSVKSDENIERLKQQYIKVTQAIRDLRNADDTTLASMKANAEAQIDKLNQMVTQYHNAEKVATQLRAKGFETVKIDTGNNIDKFINSINNSKVPIQSMQTEINKLISDFAQLDTIQDQAGKSASLTNILNTLDNAKTKFQSLKELFKGFGNKITELQGIANSAVFNKNASNLQVTQTKQEINSLITAYQNLATKLQGNITPAGLETVRTKLTQLNARFNDVTTTAKRFETELRNDNGAEKQAQRIALLKAQLTALEKANPKAMKQYGDAIKSLMATLNNNPDTRAIERVTKDIQLLRREINNANLAGKTLWQTLKEKAGKFVGWMSLTGIISSIWREMRQMVTNVVEIDKAMTNLKKVTDETDTTYARFLKNANQQAKELHSTVTDLVEQVATWSKLGYSLSESQNLAKTSMIYSNVGEVDNTTAVSDLVTVMKAFNIESEKSIRIVDSLNELGNNFATDAASLGEGLTKSASALNAANNSFEQSIALLTGGTEITQNANEMGSALKVISMRIRGKNICLRIRKVYTPCYA